jgi:hypothetical protein
MVGGVFGVAAARSERYHRRSMAAKLGAPIERAAGGLGAELAAPARDALEAVSYCLV